jgi:hypothetical protein
MRIAKKGGPKEIVRRWEFRALFFVIVVPIDRNGNIRELGKILTNGTLVDANMLQDEQAGHLVSIRVWLVDPPLLLRNC